MERWQREPKPEQEPKFKDIAVYRIRHGESVYTEYNADVETTEDDLTDAGKKQIVNTIKFIAQSLNKEQDIIVVVSSPRIRTIGSANLAKKILKEMGFNVWDDNKKRDIRWRLRSPDVLDGYGNIITKKDSGYKGVQDKLKNEIETLAKPGETFAETLARVDKVNHLEALSSAQKRARVELKYFLKSLVKFNQN